MCVCNQSNPYYANQLFPYHIERILHILLLDLQLFPLQ